MKLDALNVPELISVLGFKDTFMEEAINALAVNIFAPVVQPIAEGETVIGVMSDMEKAIWTYMKSLTFDPLEELRHSAKNTDGCAVDQFCLLLVDKEAHCHFKEELVAIREHYNNNSDDILRDRELHKKAYNFMVGLIEDRLNVEIKQIGVRAGYQIVLVP
jgi:hypothetical protein